MPNFKTIDALVPIGHFKMLADATLRVLEGDAESTSDCIAVINMYLKVAPDGFYLIEDEDEV